jgi:predicted O-methyltransferase YrrM
MRNDIPNWFDYSSVYADIATRIPDGATFVEVGAWVGHSVSFFAQEIKRHGKQCRIVAVDTFQGEPGDALQKNYAAAGGGTFRALFDATLSEASVTDMVEVIEGDSADSAKHFADRSVWGVFIDADHATESVLRDIAAWSPKVSEGGVLAGHDIDAPSVAAAVTIPHAVSGRCWIKL